MSAAPSPYPCVSCPYRKDVPSGVWHPDEYLKLPRYDLPTAEQPFGAFFCHQQNGRLCSGWVGCHDMDESMGLRMAASAGLLTPEDVDAALDYECPVELFESGAEAARHGLADVPEPSEQAKRAIDKLERRRERRGYDETTVGS
jgi:hypothetical protein